MTAKTKNKPVTWTRFGILNHLGEPWTPETFDTQNQAQIYLDQCREGWPNPNGGEPYPLAGHRVSKMKVTVRPVMPKKRK